MQSRTTSFKIASLLVRLAISVLEKIFERAKLNNSKYRSSTEGDITVVVSVLGETGVAGTTGAVDGPASTANLTLEGVDCLNCIKVSSSEIECDIM